jgi:hypothetical protein
MSFGDSFKQDLPADDRMSTGFTCLHFFRDRCIALVPQLFHFTDFGAESMRIPVCLAAYSCSSLRGAGNVNGIAVARESIDINIDNPSGRSNGLRTTSSPAQPQALSSPPGQSGGVSITAAIDSLDWISQLSDRRSG